jgi:hypothetical protein
MINCPSLDLCCRLLLRGQHRPGARQMSTLRRCRKRREAKFFSLGFAKDIGVLAFRYHTMRGRVFVDFADAKINEA